RLSPLQRHPPPRDRLRGPAHLRAGDGRERALPAAVAAEAGIAAGHARPARYADPATPVRLPERLLATLPRRDRAGRARDRPLRPAPGRRLPRPAAQPGLSRE